MNRKQVAVTVLFLALGTKIIMGYAGTVGVNDLYGFTNGYGFTWLNSTNVEGTNYYLAGVGVNARLGGDYTGFGLISDTLNTGQGANELYDMNQNVETTDSVQFDDVNVTDNIILGGGPQPHPSLYQKIYKSLSSLS